MDLLLHGLVWLALVVTGAWLLSFWPRWVADDLGLPQKDMLLRPWRAALLPTGCAGPWSPGRSGSTSGGAVAGLEFVLAAIAFFSAFRIASAFFKTASAVMRAAG
jgi:hypothetical protein